MLEITDHMVLEALQKINVNKSVGPDGIHSGLLIEVAEETTSPVAFIFNKSIAERNLASEWKKGFISSIYRKGYKILVEKYRPICLTSILCIKIRIASQGVGLETSKGEQIIVVKTIFIGARSTALHLLFYLDHCCGRLRKVRLLIQFILILPRILTKYPIGVS